MSTFNAIIDTHSNVIGYTAADSREIEIAGAVTIDGAPVNISSYRVSKSKINRTKVSVEMPSTVAHEHNGRVFYTLEA